MILDTFYLLFKSDAPQAGKDINDLEKRIESLTEKGKKRTEQENKDLKDLNKQRKEQNESLNETNSQYQKIAENILTAATAAFSFHALSKGFFGAAENNSALEVQGKLIGQSAKDIKTYGFAFEEAGGDADAFRQQIQKTSDAIFAISGQVPKISEVVAKLRDATKEGRELAIATGDTSRFNRQADLAGILPGARSFFLLPDDEAAKSIDKFQKLTENTEAAASASRDYAKSMVELAASFDKFYSAAEIKLLPVLTKITKELSAFFSGSQDSLFNKGLSESPIAKFFGLKPEDFFDKKRGESYRLSSESVFSSPEITAQRKLANGGVDPYSQYIAAGKNSLSIAENTPFGTGSINNTATRNSKQYNIKTGDIYVNTHADNVTGIATGIANELGIHLRAAAANLDDGVAY